ncbi:MAG: S8 family serine peptidase, partial [Planctomycetota bacterium]
MDRLITAVWLITAVVLLGAQSAPAATHYDLKTDKLTHPEKIMGPFEQGQEFVRVTVNLSPPRDILANTDWHSAKSLSVLREEIHTRQQQVLAALTQNESLLRHRFKNLASFSAEVSLAGLQKLSNDPRVESIEPVFLLEAHLAQGIDLMNALATRPTYNGQGIAIAICDTGVDYNHPALGGGGFPNDKVIGGYDTGGLIGDSDPIPEGESHGTSCAGIAAGDIAAEGDYIGGVAYGAKLYALKITEGSSGSASSDDMVAAWDWCISHQNDDLDNPIMVISTSFGGGQYFSSCDNAVPSMTTAANNAVSAGITLLVSSGNDGYCDSISWPACISNVISVGAVYDASFGNYYPCINANSCAPKTATTGCSTGYYATDITAADKVTSYSNTATFLDVLAPSNRAYTTAIGGYTSSFGGTSAACPYAAGAVAILQSASKAATGDYLTPDEIRSLLTSTGDDILDDKV